MGVGPLQLIILIALLLIVGYPVARILGRLGYPKALAILAFVPLVNWVALWVLAYAKWPAITRDAETFN